MQLFQILKNPRDKLELLHFHYQNAHSNQTQQDCDLSWGALTMMLLPIKWYDPLAMQSSEIMWLTKTVIASRLQCFYPPNLAE